MNPTYELGVLVDTGALVVEGRQVQAGELLYLEPGRTDITLEAFVADPGSEQTTPSRFGEVVVLPAGREESVHAAVIPAPQIPQTRLKVRGDSP